MRLNVASLPAGTNLANEIHGKTASYRHESGNASAGSRGESGRLGRVSLCTSGTAAGAVGCYAGTDGRSAGRRSSDGAATASTAARAMRRACGGAPQLGWATSRVAVTGGG